MAGTVQVTIGGKITALQTKVLQSTQVMQSVFEHWAKLYGQYSQDRFDRLASRGSAEDPEDGVSQGPWEPLKEATLGGHSRRNILILVRTGLLQKAVRAGNGTTGSVIMNGPGKFSMKATFYDDAQYPDGKTVGEVIRYHQKGGGTLPQRKVFGKLDQRWRERSASEGKQIILNAIKS